MATRFWVGGSGSWDAVTTTHWAATTGAAGGASVPGSGDTVTFDGSSGTGTVTLTTSPTIQTLTSSSANITLSAGANTISLNNVNGTLWQWIAGTFTAGTSTVTYISTSTSAVTFAGGGQTYNTVTLSDKGNTTITGSNSFTNLTMNQNTTFEQALLITAGTTQTVSGTFTYSGTSANTRGVLRSTTDGTAYTIALGVAGVVSPANITFMDANFTGTNTPISGTRLGDANGNTGITFVSTPKFWVGGTGNWTDATNHWATSTGGAAGVNNMPLPQDNFTFDANSFTANGQTVTIDRTWLGANWDCSAITWSITFNMSNVFFVLYGNLTFSVMASTTTTALMWLDGQSVTVTSNGGTMKTVELQTGIRTDSTRSFSLGDDLYCFDMIVSQGTYNSNNHNVTCTTEFLVTGTVARTVNMGSGTVRILGASGTVWDATTTTGLTFNAGTSTIIIAGASASTRTFAGGGLAYNIVRFEGTADQFSITGANTYNVKQFHSDSLALNNYAAVQAGDGMSVGEKVR